MPLSNAVVTVSMNFIKLLCHALRGVQRGTRWRWITARGTAKTGCQIITLIILSNYFYNLSKALSLRAMVALLNLGTGWGEWPASRPGRALPPGKEPPVPIGWAPEPVLTQRLEEKSFDPGRPVRSQTLYWLKYAPKDFFFRLWCIYWFIPLLLLLG
jgi:hypothetical protein